MPQQTEQQRQNAINATGQQPAPETKPATSTTSTPSTAPQPTYSSSGGAIIPTTATTTPIQTPTPASSIKPATSPTLPQPQAPQVQQSYFDSVAANVQNTRDALQTAYDTQSKQIQGQLDTLKQQQQDALAQEKTLTQPFQAQYEDTQRQLLHVNSNFEANQGLANELASLVNEANARLTGVATDFTSKSYGAAVYNKTLSDITARAGLIQSAMSAYNGQIGQAYTMIDRSVAAINADRTDQMNYYQTILSLNNQSQLDLSSQAKTLAQQKLADLQSQAADAQKTADTIKQAMLDPATAQAYAQAGVTLTDTPDQINQKLADYSYSQELATTNNQMAAKGYTTLLPGQSAPEGAQVVTIQDSKGKSRQYYQLPTSSTGTLGLSVPTVPLTDAGKPDSAAQDAFLQALPPATAALVKSVANYQMDISKVTSLRSDQRQQLAQLVTQYDPTFDMTQYAARAAMRKSVTSGTYSQAINSANLVIQHLDALKNTVDGLGNTQFQPINAAKNAFAAQTGSTAIKQFNTTADAAASELAKVFKGTGVASEEEIKNWRSNLNVNDSPQQITAAIDTAVTQLLKSRLDTIATQYQAAMGKPADFTFLTPHSIHVLQDLGVDPSQLDPSTAAAGAGGSVAPSASNPLGI